MLLRKLTSYFQSNQKVALLAITSALAMALLTLRILTTQNAGFIFLTWNLFLAWIPLLFAKWVWEKENSPITLKLKVL